MMTLRVQDSVLRLSFLLVAMSFLSCSGQEQLHRWEFSGGVGNWFSAHSCAPLTVKDGCLQIRVTGFDPYVHCSRGNDFSINVRPGVFIRMKARCSVSRSAEFFWTDTTKGDNAGFVAGEEIPFRMHGDGEFHIYNIFPTWEGRVTRLRFDPPGGEAESALVEIAFIEILALPPYEAVNGPVWSFAGGLAGFVPSHYIENFSVEPECVVLTGYGPTATLASGDLNLEADDYTWLTLDAEASAPTVFSISWSDIEGKYGSARVRIPVPEGKVHHTVRLSELKTWRDTVTGLRLQWAAVEKPVQVRFRQLALGTRPVGPAQLEVLSLGTDRAVVTQGNPVTIRATVRNAGGARLGRRSFAVAIGDKVLTSVSTPELAPGETVDVQGGVTLSEIGDHELQVITGPGERPRTIRAMVVPALPRTAPDTPRLSADSSQAVLNAGDVRLRAPAHPRESIYGPVFVEVQRDGSWHQVATMPACGGLELADSPHCELAWGEVSRAVTVPEFRFTAEHRDRSGALWRSTGIYRFSGASGQIHMIHRLEAVDGGRVSRYDGPVIRAGDGTFGSRKFEALFPGLEYLGSHEVSSSDRDILPPGDLRAVPHPNRVCIPCMAVSSPARDLVALLWDNRQHWFGDHDQPTAVFASPNLVESQDPRLSPSAPVVARTRENHLLSLFAPSIPDFMEENDVRARTPVVLTAGDAITLQSILLVRPHGEVLDAVTEWLQLDQPPPIGDAPKSMSDHYGLAVRGFEEILYTEGLGWAGVKGWDPSPNPGTALMYLYLADQLGRPELRRMALERIGSHAALPLSLHTGTVAGAVQSARNAGMSALGRRESDGNWEFRPTKKTETLGMAGDTNVGMGAGSVRQILRSAAQSADGRLLEEGLKGLDWIRKWRVPRGAQVWEIPLHAPDILASAHCCAAFLWGYRLTGDESYLKDAVYWARTGLPFVYFWQTPEEGLEPMRGGTIPIFGATFYVGSWFGRLVQWCGLEYAKVLLDLAPYDDSHDWRSIGRDITVSGWRQQQEKDGYQGLYPDSWSMLTGDISWGLMLGPQRLVQNQLTLDGFTPNGDTRLFRRGKSQVALLGPGEFADVSVGTAGDGTRITELPSGSFRMTFEHRFRPDPVSYIALVGVTEPKRVEANGVILGASTDLSAVSSGWCWSPAMPGLTIKLTDPPAESVRVIVDGLDILPPPKARTGWTFEDSTQGWTPDHDLAPLTVHEGALVCKPTGNDPYLCVRIANLDAQKYPCVTIRCKTPDDGPLQVFWATLEGGFAPARSLSTSVRGGNTWQTVTIDLTQKATWRSAVVAFRIDPPLAGLEIDEVRFVQPAGAQ